MGLLKKIGQGLKKVIKPNGLLSKIVSKIPVIGGIATGAIDIVGGLVQKISPNKKGTANKQTAGSSFVEAYQATTGNTAGAAIDASIKLSDSAKSPFVIYIGIGFAVLVAILFFLFRRKR